MSFSTVSDAFSLAPHAANHRHIDHHATEPLPYFIDELPAETTFSFQLNDEDFLDLLQQGQPYQPWAPSPVSSTSPLAVPVIPNANAQVHVAPPQSRCHNCSQPVPGPSSLYSWSDAPQCAQYDSSLEDRFSSLTISDPQIPLASYSTARTKSGRRSSRKSNKENAGPSASHGPDRVKAHRRKTYSPYAYENPSRTPLGNITNETTTIRPRKTSNTFMLPRVPCPVYPCSGCYTDVDHMASHFKGYATSVLTGRSARGLKLSEEHIAFIEPIVYRADSELGDPRKWRRCLKAEYKGLFE